MTTRARVSLCSADSDWPCCQALRGQGALARLTLASPAEPSPLALKDDAACLSPVLQVSRVWLCESQRQNWAASQPQASLCDGQRVPDPPHVSICRQSPHNAETCAVDACRNVSSALGCLVKREMALATAKSSLLTLHKALN